MTNYRQGCPQSFPFFPSHFRCSSPVPFLPLHHFPFLSVPSPFLLLPPCPLHFSLSSLPSPSSLSHFLLFSFIPSFSAPFSCSLFARSPNFPFLLRILPSHLFLPRDLNLGSMASCRFCSEPGRCLRLQFNCYYCFLKTS